MKQILVLFTVLTISVGSVRARVGETEQELATRYGNGELSGNQRLPGAKTWKYAKSGFQIEVVIFDGKSVWEIIKKVDGNIADGDIKTVLDGYKAPGQTWTFDRQKKLWAKSGRPKIVAYRWPGHEDFFCVKDSAACAEIEKKNTGAPGF